MYNLFKNIIDHTMSSNYSYEEQFIYAMCGALILIFTVYVLDTIRRLFSRSIGK